MITHASLFSGIGAADLAARELGWRNIFNCEIDQFCRMVLDYHFPEADKYNDIKQTDFRKYEGQINVLSGGFPCQSFSVAGRRRGTEDDRYLWPQMLRAITEIKPNYILGENVGGILTMVSPVDDVEVGSEADLFGESHTIHEEHGRFVADIIRADLEREGYTLQIFVIPACAIGAPHRRDRVWFVAKRNVADTKSQQSERLQLKQSETCRPKQGQLRGDNFEDDSPSDTDISGDRTQAAHNRPKANGGGNNVLPCERGEETERVNGCGDVQSPDTLRTGLERVAGLRIQESERRGVIGELGRFTPCRSTSRWRGFPTTEPVIRRGDDGISERLDTDTISFAKWRREAIKAYGNSMVMPLVKEIFIAIQKDIEHDRKIR